MSGRLRTYAPMRRQSVKRQKNAPNFRAVYRTVAKRSDGWCEAWDIDRQCVFRGVDFHHTRKPRRSHHTPEEVVHLCRGHHDRCDWPYTRGRLIVTPLGDGRFTFHTAYKKVR